MMTHEQKVGVFFLAGLVVLGVLTFRVEHLSDLFREYETVFVTFSSAHGLVPGDAVTQAGVKVGEVKSIEIRGSRVLVELRVAKGTAVRKNSEISIAVDNLLGGKHVDITLGSPEQETISPGSVVPGRETPTLTELFRRLDGAIGKFEESVAGPSGPLESLRTAGKLFATAQEIAEKINRGRGTLGKLVNDDTLYRGVTGMVAENRENVRIAIKHLAEISPRLSAAAKNIETLTNRLANGTGTLPKLMQDGQVYADLRRSLESLRLTLEDIRSGRGTLGKLLQDPTLYDELHGAVREVKQVALKINQGTGTFGRLVNDPSLYEEAKRTISSLGELSTSLSNGEGTLGRLITDKELYEKARRVLDEVEEAARGYREQIPIGAFTSVVFSAF